MQLYLTIDWWKTDSLFFCFCFYEKITVTVCVYPSRITWTMLSNVQYRFLIALKWLSFFVIKLNCECYIERQSKLVEFQLDTFRRNFRDLNNDINCTTHVLYSVFNYSTLKILTLLNICINDSKTTFNIYL